jgi:hypothetical protein
MAPASRPFRLAIVGSHSLDGHPDALRVIRDVLDACQARHADLTVVSGGAAGIDRMAATEARRRGLQVIEHLPSGTTWRHYRERNERIARDCDELVRIADAHSRTYGSGWTCDRARELGRPTTEYAITGRPAAPCAPWPLRCEGTMPDCDQIDPARDRVWAVDVSVNFTTYVVAETAHDAERIAEQEEGVPRYSAHELTAQLPPYDPDYDTIPYGASRWEDRDLTVHEAVELLEPVYDRQTLLMPFAESPPPLHPRRIDDYLALRRSA